jgi:hypothetical protein
MIIQSCSKMQRDLDEAFGGDDCGDDYGNDCDNGHNAGYFAYG